MATIINPSGNATISSLFPSSLLIFTRLSHSNSNIPCCTDGLNSPNCSKIRICGSCDESICVDGEVEDDPEENDFPCAIFRV
jgi:hypothetical protein